MSRISRSSERRKYAVSAGAGWHEISERKAPHSPKKLHICVPGAQERFLSNPIAEFQTWPFLSDSLTQPYFREHSKIGQDNHHKNIEETPGLRKGRRQ
jgi:hypothetical protein